jgi:hypothetical protein
MPIGQTFYSPSGANLNLLGEDWVSARARTGSESPYNPGERREWTLATRRGE